MIQGYDDKLDNEAYYGMYSLFQMNTASIFLNGLGVRHEFRERKNIELEEIIAWGALDETSKINQNAFDLCVLTDDINKIDRIAFRDLFPDKDYL